MLVALAIGCTPTGGRVDPDPTPTPDDDDDATPRREDEGTEDYAWGDEVVCDSPASGWGRFTEEGEARGLTRPLTGTPAEDYFDGQAAVAASDLDGDGDIDLVVGQHEAAPLVWFNDGAGFFGDPLVLVGPYDPDEVFTAALGAVDIDGDRLPDIVAVQFDLYWWRNLGGGLFGEPQIIAPGTDRFQSGMVFGDLDGDGDLDLFASTSVLQGGEAEAPLDQIYLSDGSGLEYAGIHAVSDVPGVSSRVPLFTDRDLDGDVDLFEPNDNYLDAGQVTAFFQNVGTPGGPVEFVEDGQAVGVAVPMRAMGVDSADLNGDGRLDYCVTDVGLAVCFMSQVGDGVSWVDARYVAGLEPVEGPYPESDVSTIGWSIDLADLNNDGYVDAVQASGADHGDLRDAGRVRWPDLVWEGQPDGSFVEVTDAAGFGDRDSNFGVATADLDGDGSLDVVIVGPGHRPMLHMNRCGAESWLELELVGPPENPEGFGAVAWVEDSRRTFVRELYNVRATGQSVSRFHFGLGQDETAAHVTVRWPDGRLSDYTDLPARRIVTVTHPDAR